MSDNYVLMLSKLPENGWELAVGLEKFTRWRNAITLDSIQTSPTLNTDDLLQIAGIDTVEGFEKAYTEMVYKELVDEPGIHRSNFKSMREVFLAFCVRKKLGLVWNHETQEWEKV